MMSPEVHAARSAKFARRNIVNRLACFGYSGFCGKPCTSESVV